MTLGYTKEQKAEYMRDYRRANPEKFRDLELRKRFGISAAEYDSMLEKQKGVCQICSQPETKVDHRTKLPRRLAVDHCHKTGKVRGLLCSDCNTAIGLLKDDIDLMQKAIEYVSGA